MVLLNLPIALWRRLVLIGQGLAALIAPSALATGWPETFAALAAAVAATRLPLLGVIVVGVVAVVALRHAGF